MPVIINQTEDRVLLRFNSGVTYTLGPREELEVEHVEVKGNDRIRHLEERRRVAVQRDEERPERPRGGGRRGAAARKEQEAEEGGAEDEEAEAGEGNAGRGGLRPRLRRRKAKPEE